LICVKPVSTPREKRIFLTFPWKIYRGDPIWVPPLIPERRKALDPRQGLFFKEGNAEFFIAWKDDKPVGTICCAEDLAATRFNGYGDCMFGFFECIEDYKVAEALLQHAEIWARQRGLHSIVGPYNLNRDDSRGLLAEGRDRPPVVFCGHTPPYYLEFFDRYGIPQQGEDGVAYAVDLDLDQPQAIHLAKLAERVRRRKSIIVRGAKLDDVEGEIDRIHDLMNRALAHLPFFTTWPRSAIEELVRPMIHVVDPELVLMAEIDGKPAGWFPGVPNLNEIFIHANGFRYPWDYLRVIPYKNYKPKCLAIKSVLVAPEYWDTGVAILLFDEMAQRAAAKGYQWVDLSITGVDNPDTGPLALRMGAKIYKRYRIFQKNLVNG
jgi:GNAT superfamily N-acetyltransferase